MRILTHFLSVAMVCLVHTVAAQPVFDPALYGSLASAAASASVQVSDPVSAGKGKLKLYWNIHATVPVEFINIERSINPGGPFEVLAAIRQNGNQGSFIDEQPLKGSCFYRIRWASPSGSQQYSKTVSSFSGGEMVCKFYPNPVDNMLIVRSEHALDLLLTDAGGKIFTNVKLKSGLQSVDLSTLDKGLYIITLTNLESGQVLTEKLIKN